MQISGRVVRGKQEARGVGYPTANVAYTGTDHPKAGVWTCWLTVDGMRLQGVAIVGMWHGQAGEPSVEVHVMDGEHDLYDKEVEIVFGEYLRPLINFEEIDELRRQIQQDLEQARTWFLQQASS
jgi:riboflavin kinase / FMN adenylyltransferase